MNSIPNKLDEITQVAQTGLCIGCGTCVAVCPQDAIAMDEDSSGLYKPSFVPEICSKCQRCIAVCPGISISYDALTFTKDEARIYNPILGYFRRIYLVDSTNSEILYNAASGGATTSILSYLINSKHLNGVIVSRLVKEGNKFHGQTEIVTDDKDLMKFMGSVYYPTKTNEILKKLKHLNGKYAVVGLPCQVAGIKKMRKIEKEIFDKIFLTLGIFCSHVPNRNALYFLLNQYEIDANNVKDIRFRGSGFPGKMKICLKDNQILYIPFPEYYDRGFGLFFKPKRCTLCIDATAELADISFGEFWDRSSLQGEEKKSVVITRTQKGEDIFRDTERSGYITTREIDESALVNTQSILKKKKEKLALKYHRALRKPVPDYDLKIDITLHDLLKFPRLAMWDVGYFLAKNSMCWFLLRYYIGLKMFKRKIMRSVKGAIRNTVNHLLKMK